MPTRKRATRRKSNTSNTNPTEGTENGTVTDTNEESTAMSATDTAGTHEVVFVDELPKIARNVESGVWVERLAPLRENPNKWAQIYVTKPGASPHAQVNNLRSGNAAGINPDDYEFKGRSVATGETDEDGKPVTQGLVFARYLEGDVKEEVAAQRAERQRKAAERKAEKANA